MRFGDADVSDGLLTINEAASFLRVARSTIYRLLDDGRIRWVPLGRGRRLRRRDVLRVAAVGLPLAPATKRDDAEAVAERAHWLAEELRDRARGVSQGHPREPARDLARFADEHGTDLEPIAGELASILDEVRPDDLDEVTARWIDLIRARLRAGARR